MKIEFFLTFLLWIRLGSIWIWDFQEEKNRSITLWNTLSIKVQPLESGSIWNEHLYHIESDWHFQLVSSLQKSETPIYFDWHEGIFFITSTGYYTCKTVRLKKVAYPKKVSVLLFWWKSKKIGTCLNFIHTTRSNKSTAFWWLLFKCSIKSCQFEAVFISQCETDGWASALSSSI